MHDSWLSPWFVAPLAATGAAVACSAILWFLLATGLAWRLATDIPNDRSLHVRPTPRVGGWGVVPVSVVALIVSAPPIWLFSTGPLFLAAISQIDDRRGLPARVRFAAHFAAVAALVITYPAAAPWWVLVG